MSEPERLKQYVDKARKNVRTWPDSMQRSSSGRYLRPTVAKAQRSDRQQRPKAS